MNKSGYGRGEYEWDYKPLLDYVPSVFEGLLTGQFHYSPLGEFRKPHPMIRIPQDFEFLYERLEKQVVEKGYHSYTNVKAFDNVVLHIAKLFASKITLTAMLGHVVDDIREFWLVTDYEDPYHDVLKVPGGISRFQEIAFRDEMAYILRECLTIYCRLYNIDYGRYAEYPRDTSSMTITKNIYDEISVIFHDVVSGNYVCFYFCFPALVLGTLTVAHVAV